MPCPGTLQEILTIAMQYAAYDMYARSYHESAVNWASIEQEYPEVQIRTFSPEIISAMKQANDELLAESAARMIQLSKRFSIHRILYENGTQMDRDF